MPTHATEKRQRGHAQGRLRVSEVFGLTPLSQRAREVVLMLRGDQHTPKARWVVCALEQLTRVPGPRVWAGQRPAGRRVLISNLVNRTPTPPEDGWSVRATQVRDFRGGRQSYDSHNGTDFATPVGTRVVAGAPGVVRRVSSEFHRGGLKVFIDHGAGLVTGANHLARALVREGDRVTRGQVVALSGYSGVDGLVTFPWGIPHVHWNVFLNGRHVDPFAEPGEVSLWRGSEPAPFRGTQHDADAEPLPASDWNARAIERGLRACLSDESRAEIEAAQDLAARGVAYVFHSAYFPTRFRERPSPYTHVHPRAPHLTLPFLADDYDGVAFETA
jgi:murein DD-endopeptidase